MVAWSAGAMALTDRVVLYNDRGPQGVAAPRSGTAGWDGCAASWPCRTRDAGSGSTTRWCSGSWSAGSPTPAACCSTTAPGSTSGPTASCPTGPGAHQRLRRRSAPWGDCHDRRPGRRPAIAAASELAINRLIDRRPLDAGHDRPVPGAARGPIVEGARATFLWRGEADEVMVRHRVVGLPDPLPLRRIRDTDLWYVTTELPEGSRGRVPVRDRPRRAPRGATSTTRSTRSSRTVRSGRARCCSATGYEVPDWCLPDPEARPGEIVEQVITSKALRRQVPFYALPPGALPDRACATRC